jgi:hypothetical protein
MVNIYTLPSLLSQRSIQLGLQGTELHPCTSRLLTAIWRFVWFNLGYYFCHPLRWCNWNEEMLIAVLDRVIASMKLRRLMWRLQIATKNSHLRVLLSNFLSIIPTRMPIVPHSFWFNNNSFCWAWSINISIEIIERKLHPTPRDLTN